MCVFIFLSSVVENEEQIHSSSCLPNELLLSLFHSSLEHELSDREIPLADSDHIAFMHHILERDRDGHVAPFSLPVIKGQYMCPHLISALLLTSVCDFVKGLFPYLGGDICLVVSRFIRYKEMFFVSSNVSTSYVLYFVRGVCEAS